MQEKTVVSGLDDPAHTERFEQPRGLPVEVHLGRDVLCGDAGERAVVGLGLGDPRARLFDDAPVLAPEAGALSVEPSALGVGATGVLAREASDDEIHVAGKLSCADFANVTIPPHARETGLEHADGGLFDLDLSDDLEARALRREIEKADAGEQRNRRPHLAAYFAAGAGISGSLPST